MFECEPKNLTSYTIKKISNSEYKTETLSDLILRINYLHDKKP